MIEKNQITNLGYIVHNNRIDFKKQPQIDFIFRNGSKTIMICWDLKSKTVQVINDIRNKSVSPNFSTIEELTSWHNQNI